MSTTKKSSVRFMSEPWLSDNILLIGLDYAIINLGLYLFLGYFANIEKVLTTTTAENERISIELDMARRIQAESLPNNFPPFPERTEFDIYASMQPAKEVGGDFYDFFLLDADHLGLGVWTAGIFSGSRSDFETLQLTRCRSRL